MKVIAKYTRDLNTITRNKTYNVIDYQDAIYHADSAYTFAAYITIINDAGKKQKLHAHRFEILKNN